MGFIPKKTREDLEFDTVLKTVQSYCLTDLGKKKVQKISPFPDQKTLMDALEQVCEYNNSLISENRIPNHFFEDLSTEIQLLNIENSQLETTAFLKICQQTKTVDQLRLFFEKFKDYYPTLRQQAMETTPTTAVVTAVEKIISPYGEVLNNASTYLNELRKEMHETRSKINRSFAREMQKYEQLGFLDEIRESVIENQRVLAVQAVYRRKVKGSLLGSSKTGSIAFMAPQAALEGHRELQKLAQDESEEIRRLLKALTDFIRPFASEFSNDQHYLTQLDCVGAKAKYALETHAVMPRLSETKKIHFINAYHPILIEKNKPEQIPVIPQTLSLHEQQQILVISGPNAGGKSITLKTVGLLQIMFQSGLLIPVDEKSETYFFDKILTDIGDNQSIENQLSTYSYRLKNMRGFLKKCDENTLFLIDEFGTGSDPELGGALAEIFLEEFHQKKAYGLITTHYANLKVLADELEHVRNANMQFDEKTLSPQFELQIGQAGSSFTFEVAQKNGIPFRLINRAKKKVEGEKIRLDKTISKLQKERNFLQKNTKALEAEQEKAKVQTQNLSEKELKLVKKLNRFQELYDNHQKMLTFGRKTNELIQKYFQTNNKNGLMAGFYKWVLMEKNKQNQTSRKKQNPEKKKRIEQERNTALKKIEKEVLEQVAKVREEKRQKAKKTAPKKAAHVYKVRDKVRLIDGKACGVIDKIEKNKVTIDYGRFTTQATLDKIELVKASK